MRFFDCCRSKSSNPEGGSPGSSIAISVVALIMLVGLFIIQLTGTREIDPDNKNPLYQIMVWLGAVGYFLDNFPARTRSTRDGFLAIGGCDAPHRKVRELKEDRLSRGMSEAFVYDMVCVVLSYISVFLSSFMQGGYAWYAFDRLVDNDYAGALFFLFNGVISFFFRANTASIGMQRFLDRIVHGEVVAQKLAAFLLLAVLTNASRPYGKYYHNIITNGTIGVIDDFTTVPEEAAVPIKEVVRYCAMYNFATSAYPVFEKMFGQPKSYFKDLYSNKGFFVLILFGLLDVVPATYFACHMYGVKSFETSLQNIFNLITIATYSIAYFGFYCLGSNLPATGYYLKRQSKETSTLNRFQDEETGCFDRIAQVINRKGGQRDAALLAALIKPRNDMPEANKSSASRPCVIM